MNDNAAAIIELDRRIAAVRDNIRDLIERAAAVSGAGGEDALADRIAQREDDLARLIGERDALRSNSSG